MRSFPGKHGVLSCVTQQCEQWKQEILSNVRKSNFQHLSLFNICS